MLTRLVFPGPSWLAILPISSHCPTIMAYNGNAPRSSRYPPPHLPMPKLPAVHLTQVIEIRASHDRNRLLATYDPARAVLRLFHRGQTIVVRLAELDPAPDDALPPVDIN